MTCREIIEFLMQYLDGELPPDQMERFHQHMGECPACVAYLDTYHDTIRLEQAACAEDDALCRGVPEELIQAILAARRAEK
jgi:anti-sigma factor RsiW